MSRTKPGSRWLLILVMIVVIGWPVYQLYGYVVGGPAKQDSTRELYEVSNFQMSLLGSFLNDSAKLHETTALDAIKLTAYMADYTHTRLVSVLGSDRLAALESLPALVSYVSGLQIGGNRPLKEQESATLAAVKELFQAMDGAYGKLLSSGGSVIASENSEVGKLDTEITELLRGNILQ